MPTIKTEQDIEDIITNLDNQDAPDIIAGIERASLLISQSPREEQERLRKKYEPLLDIYRTEHYKSHPNHNPSWRE